MPSFLIDASVPREANVVVAASGHISTDVRDIGLRHASDDQIAAYAKARQLCIITRDFDFTDVRVYPPLDYCGIVVLNPTHRGDRQATLALLSDFCARIESFGRSLEDLRLWSHCKSDCGQRYSPVLHYL